MLAARIRTRFGLFCLAAALVIFTPTLHAASEWKIIKVGPRDYLSAENVAKFYGFPADVKPSGPQGKTLNLDNGRNQLQVTLDSRECVINGVRNWLSFPVIAKDNQFLISRVDLAKTIEPQLRPHMIPNLGRFNTVVLDPGHGGYDKGACSSFGCEKDYTLDIGRQLKPLLEAKGFKVIMTRDSDVFIPLEQRARIANSTRDSIFVSIHLNATDWNPAAAGFEIYSLTPRGAPSTQDDALALRFFNVQIGSPVDAPSLALSMSIYHSIVGHLAEPDRGIKRARFAVLRLTKIPAVLVEGGFLTERHEGREIANSEWRAKYAQAISIGIENYKLLVDKRQRPMMLADYQRQLGGTLIARDVSTLAPDSAAIIPASNTQHLVGAAPAVNQDGSAAPARSEQEQDEPAAPPPNASPAAPVVAANSPPVAPAPEETSPTPEEVMPDAPAPSPPVVAKNSPTPAPRQPSPPVAQSPPPAPKQIVAAKTSGKQPLLQIPSLGQRILRWVPMMPDVQP